MEHQPNPDDSHDHTYPDTVATTTHPTQPDGLRHIETEPFPERATRRMDAMDRRISQMEAAMARLLSMMEPGK